MRKDNLTIAYFHNVDKVVDISFNQIIDAVGETIIAEVYLIGGSQVGIVNATGYTTTGGQKGDQRTVICDFSNIPVGTGYSVVFRTVESGVIAKGVLVVYAEDGFSTDELSGVTVPPNTYENDVYFNTDLTITNPGYYVFYGSTPRTVTLADAIARDVVFITEATARLNFSGTNFHPSFRKYLRENTSRLTLRWNDTSQQYNF